MQDQMIPVARIELKAPAPRPSLARRLVGLTLMAAAVGSGAWAWSRGYRPAWLKGDEGPRYELVEVDRGDIANYVVEFGTVESASDAVVKCQVEALTGLVGGSGANGGMLVAWYTSQFALDRKWWSEVVQQRQPHAWL